MNSKNDWRTETLPAALQAVVTEQNNGEEPVSRHVTIVEGDLEFSVEGDKIVDSEIIVKRALEMEKIVNAEQQLKGKDFSWILYISYEGRLWYIQPTDATAEENYHIGYLVIDNIEGIMALFEQGMSY